MLADGTLTGRGVPFSWHVPSIREDCGLAPTTAPSYYEDVEQSGYTPKAYSKDPD